MVPTAVLHCSLTLAALSVTQVNVELLFSAMRLLVGRAVPTQAGCRPGDAPSPHEHDLNML